jgi:hypothetical protein
MAFDPCREWLGIDAVELGNPGRVLGLPPGCSDPAAISRAADARLQSLRQVAPGPFAKAHSALVARVEEARDSLLAAAFAGGRSAQAVEPRPSFAPRPAAPAPPFPGWVGADEAASPVVARFPAAEPEEEPVLGPSLGPIVRRTAPRRNASSGAGGLLLASFALLLAAVAVLVFLMLRPDPFARQVAVKKPTVGATAPPTGTKPSTGGAPSTPRQPEPPKQPGMASASTPPATGGSTLDDAGAGDPAPDEQEAKRRRQETESQKREAERLRREKQEQASREAEMAEQKAAAAAREAEESRRRAEMAAEDDTQEAEQEQARMQEGLDKAIRDAYAALQRGEFDTADRAIAAAGNQVGDDVEAAKRIENWRLLATYAREFTKFREQAFAAANAGRDYEIDGKPFAIIEINSDMIVYRWDGQNKRVPRDQVHPRIELAVVEGWFAADGRAANHLFLGARWLCLDPPNPTRARAEWRIAGDGGEQVAPLNALLDDPVIQRAGR